MPATHIDESRPDAASPREPGARADGQAGEFLAEPTSVTPESRGERVVTTRELLGGGHRLWIQHATQRYLLQVTRNGKLILTK